MLLSSKFNPERGGICYTPHMNKHENTIAFPIQQAQVDYDEDSEPTYEQMRELMLNIRQKRAVMMNELNAGIRVWGPDVEEALAGAERMEKQWGWLLEK